MTNTDEAMIYFLAAIVVYIIYKSIKLIKDTKNDIEAKEEVRL